MGLKKYWQAPDACYRSVDELPLADYFELGYRWLFLDADNTLQEHGQKRASEAAVRRCRRMEQVGFQLLLCSNAKQARAQALAESLGIPYLAEIHKPRGSKIRVFLREHHLSADRVLFIGDQVFTDLWAGRAAGLPVILLSPLTNREPFYIRLKRGLEYVWRRIVGCREGLDSLRKP